MSSLCIPPTKWVFDADREPPVYTRPLIGNELLLHRHANTYDGETEICIGVDFTSSLRIEELKGRARAALNKLRLVCPIVACTIEGVASPRWVYTPSADREAWLDLSFAVEERGTSLNVLEFVENTNLKRLPYTNENGITTLFRVYLLTTSKEGDDDKKYGLYFHSSHCIIDARPASHALDLMFGWMDDEGMDVKIEPLEEWRNLPVDPITATGGLSKEWDTVGAKLLQDCAEQSARTAPIITLAPPSRPVNTVEPRFRYAASMSESDTAAIMAQAKKLGVSVSALFHAANCLAQFNMNSTQETTKVDFAPTFGFLHVSLERYFKPPVDPKTHIIASATISPIRFSMTQPLMEPSERERLIMTAKLAQERMDKYLANPCLPQLLAVLSTMKNFPSGGEQNEDDMTSDKARADKAPTYAYEWVLNFQNLGIVDKTLRTQRGKMTIGNLCLGGRTRSTLTCHMWTMHSKLHFQSLGPIAWGEDRIKKLVDETLRIASLVLDES